MSQISPKQYRNWHFCMHWFVHSTRYKMWISQNLWETYLTAF